MNIVGYTKPLYILPFDHKTSFITKLFAWDYYNLTPEQRKTVEKTRMMIYEGFLKAVAKGMPKEDSAILTDEEFGSEVLKRAKAEGYVTLLTTEKSGQEMFTFDYGADWQSHIEKFSPTFTKALIRYNPEGDTELNKKQLDALQPLCDYSHEKGYKFLIEPLIPATKEQLASVADDKMRYDTELRPALTVKMMQELQNAGIEPDVWKIEGFGEQSAYESAIAQARSNDRNDVSIVILGRGGSSDEVKQWFSAGKEVTGVNGFAVGRTIFMEPLEKWHNAEIDEDSASTMIGENFFQFYQFFVSK